MKHASCMSLRWCQILNYINFNISIKIKFNQECSHSLLVKSKKSQNKMHVACNIETHPLYYCDKFKNMKLPGRIIIVNKNKICLNCLSNSQLLSQYNTRSICFVCQSKFHYTYLHKYTIPKYTDINITDIIIQTNALHNAYILLAETR